MKNILITGATGGFGLLTVKELLSKGYKVGGSVRDIAGRNKDKAAEIAALGAFVFELDVTSDKSVDHGIKMAAEKLGGIDVLINNSGIGTNGYNETFDAEDFKKLYDVNVFGVQRTIKASMPYLRASKDAMIINVSSLLARFTIPFRGPYGSSKWALEGLTESYRYELNQSGIDVCLVEPGAFPTAFGENCLKGSDQAAADHYANLAPFLQSFFKAFSAILSGTQEQKPVKVAEAISKLIATKAGERPFRTTVDAIGMSTPIKEYNELSTQFTQKLFNDYGILELTKLKK